MNHRNVPNAGSGGTLDESATSVRTRLGRLHVRSTGTGTPTVLWSSMFVDSHTWDRMIPLLPTGRRYLLVDPPGLGRSEALDHASDITGAADAATDLLDGLGVHDPVDWVGNAFGGHVGFTLAARQGVLRSLVAISSPAQPVAPALRRQISILLPILRAAGPVGPVRSAVLTAMLTDASAADDAIRRVVEESMGRPTRRSMALAVRSFILNRVDVTGELPDITVPSLFVSSDDRGDWTPQDAQAAADLVPGAEAVVVAGARTLVPLEQPEEVAAHVRRFWDRLT
ncbi:alpha/beta fold hydrolase [Knoellia locipacati]|uniref:Putative hydrolase, alpha/beta fold protein n=1 Tax=Knoellia locipacati TaxID=882824 RepID=A0A512SZC1_9MICO|nr:alpha/beta fold hydrolase [Knoellia locipacati]GEQ13312.1 putative hydrolase, alpha/beta fold protein [Knoellia locipacati]